MRAGSLSMAALTATLAITIALAPEATAEAAENGEIAFTGLERKVKQNQDENTYGLYLRRTDGKVSRSLMANPGDRIDISSNGRWIVTSRLSHKQYDLFLVSTRGGPVRRLTDTPQRSESSASFSPSGSRIAFQLDAKKGKSGIAVMPRGGRHRQRIIFESRSAYEPSWGPSGEIVFIRGGKLTVVGSDGKGARSFSNRLPGSDFTPQLSPDGGEIVFKHYAEGGVQDLYVFDVATKEARPLFVGQGDSYDPVYSPDGARVLFARVPGRRNSRFTERLYTVDADDGSDLERVEGLGAFSVIETASWAEAR